jgi:hypothetical protein
MSPKQYAIMASKEKKWKYHLNLYQLNLNIKQQKNLNILA